MKRVEFNTLEGLKLFYTLQGKTVCVIGGYDAISAEMAEAADVVVRINQHWRRQGGRIDGMYMATCDPFTPPAKPPIFMAYRITGVYMRQYQLYCIEHGVIQVPFQNELYAGVSPLGPEYEWTNVLNKRIGAKPFTGMLAIAHLLSFPVKAVYVTGMDFYQKCQGFETLETLDGGTIRKRDAHVLDPQMAWLKQLAAEDARLYIDRDLWDSLPS